MMAPQPDARELRQAARIAVQERLIERPQPPPDFNALRASDEQLLRHGIMPKPRENRVLLRLWEKALSPPQQLRALQFEELKFEAEYRLARPITAFARDVGALSQTPSRFGRSRNWSGAYVVANRYRRFTVIGAAWNVPMPKAPETPDGDLIDDTYRAVTWIGFDGNYLRSRSLPQAGTTQSVTVVGGAAASPTYEVWFQWWVRDQLFPPVTFDPVKYPVGEGDEMLCILAVDKTSGIVFVLLANLRKFWTVPIHYGTNEAGLGVEGSTAEWIVERPTHFEPPYRLYPLPNYGHVVFEDCITAEAHDPPLGAPGDLTDARRVRMTLEVIGPPHRSAVISRPKKLDANTLQASYRAW